MLGRAEEAHLGKHRNELESQKLRCINHLAMLICFFRNSTAAKVETKVPARPLSWTAWNITIVDHSDIIRSNWKRHKNGWMQRVTTTVTPVMIMIAFLNNRNNFATSYGSTHVPNSLPAFQTKTYKAPNKLQRSHSSRSPVNTGHTDHTSWSSARERTFKGQGLKRRADGLKWSNTPVLRSLPRGEGDQARMLQLSTENGLSKQFCMIFAVFLWFKVLYAFKKPWWFCGAKSCLKPRKEHLGVWEKNHLRCENWAAMAGEMKSSSCMFVPLKVPRIPV